MTWIKIANVCAANVSRPRNGSAQSASGAGGGLGGLLSGLLGGTSGTAPGLASLLDLNREGNPLDEILKRTMH